MISHSPLPVTYVVGSSHSGSTLLALLADEHPRVASVGETAVKRRARREGRALSQQCSCGLAVRDCGFWQRIFRRVAPAGVSSEAVCWRHEYRFDSTLLDLALTRETSVAALRRFRRWTARYIPSYRARIAHIDRANVAFVRAVLDETGASVFVDTTKLLTRLSYLLEIPDLDLRVVRLVRDVRGFAASAKRRGVSAVHAARVWRNDQLAAVHALAALPADRVLLIRYEDLCARVGETLSRVWRFCGVEPIDPPVVIRSGDHHVLGNNMRVRGTIEVRLDESWKATLDAGEKKRILRVAGRLNSQLGYA